MRYAAYMLLCGFGFLAISAGACDVDVQVGSKEDTGGGENAAGQTPGISVSELLFIQMWMRYEIVAAEYSSFQSTVPFTYLNVRFVSPQDLPPNDQTAKAVFIAPNTIEVAVPGYSEDWFAAALRDFFEGYYSSLDSWAPGGLEISELLMEYLAITFEETRECAGASNFPQGRFQDLSVLLMPQTFLHEDKYLWGYFSLPNEILLGGDQLTFAHEVIHYLLYMNTGSADGAHVSPLFSQCSRPTD